MNLILPVVRAECKCALCKEITKIDLDLAHEGTAIECVVSSALNDEQTGFYHGDIFVCANCFDAFVELNKHLKDEEILSKILEEYELAPSSF